MGSSGASVASVPTPFSVTGNPAVINIGDGNLSRPAGGPTTLNGGMTVVGALMHGGGNLAFFNHGGVGQAPAQVAPANTASTNVGPFGFTTAAQADAIVANIIGIRAALLSYGLII